MTGSARRIWAMMYRHLSLYRRSWPRVLELSFFPVVQMMVWGFTSSFLAARTGNALLSGTGVAAGGAAAGGALLGGVLLWEVALRSQMGFSVSFLEELWSRNLGHVFVSPLRPAEMLTALAGMSVLRTALGVGPAAMLAAVFYHFNLLAVGPVLALFIANLMVMGWWVALSVVALILRHGAGAEALAWSVIFALAPISAVFYPVSVLPYWLQPVALALPAAHVFEGLRAALLNGIVRWDHLAWASVLNLAWLCIAALLFARQFRQARINGALISIGE